MAASEQVKALAARARAAQEVFGGCSQEQVNDMSRIAYVRPGSVMPTDEEIWGK